MKTVEEQFGIVVMTTDEIIRDFRGTDVEDYLTRKGYVLRARTHGPDSIFDGQVTYTLTDKDDLPAHWLRHVQGEGVARYGLTCWITGYNTGFVSEQPVYEASNEDDNDDLAEQL